VIFNSAAPLSLPPRRRASGDSGGRIAPFRREMYRLLLEGVRVRAWDRVLAVESGDGWAAEEAWRRLTRGYVCGLSSSPRKAELASRLRGVEGHLEFKVWNRKKFEFPDCSFDCVLSSFAMDRFSEPVATLREVRRVLRPGGDVYILEPDRKSFYGLYLLWDYYLRLADRLHRRYYSTAELLQLLVEAGFAGSHQLMCYEKLLTGGKVLATATVVHARRSPWDEAAST